MLLSENQIAVNQNPLLLVMGFFVQPLCPLCLYSE
jgi:hypothetical protein